MPVITVAGLKGGIGKTTSALLLSEAAARSGHRVALIDGDPQRSAQDWADEAGIESFTVYPLTGKRHRHSIDTIAAAHDVTIVDCPPGETDITVTTAAIGAADLVLVPCTPTMLDVPRLVRTLDLCEAHDRHAVVLITKTDQRWRAHRDLSLALQGDDNVDVLTTSIAQTVRISTSYSDALAEGLHGYGEAWAELEQRMKG